MNKFHKMINRANLQSIGKFIQYEGTANILDGADFEAREEKAVQNLKAKLKGIISEQEYRKIIDTVMEYTNDCSEIYFSVGMKVGARIVFQLLNDSMKDSG